MAANIEALTTAALALAMDAASLRQQAIASNVANHATPGYVPRQVDFEAQLQQARAALESRGMLDEASLSSVRPRMEPVLGADGLPAPVHLDAEMADMARNTVQYQALARALNRHFSLLHSAAGDGKR